MLTPRGRSVLAMSIVFLVIGRVLALRELSMAAAALDVMLAFAVVNVLLRRGSLRVMRWRVNGGGSTGKCCVGAARSPASVAAGMARSVTGKSGLPVRRSSR